MALDILDGTGTAQVLNTSLSAGEHTPRHIVIECALPTGASQDRTTAAIPFSVRLSDGAAFYNAPIAAQLPTSLVGGRLDGNIGSWFGATTPTVGQKAMTASIPVALASDQSAIPAAQSGAWTVSIGGSVTIGASALPTGAAQDRTTAAAPAAVRLSDGSAFYNTPTSAQFPALLVGDRLDTNTGSWMGSTAPTVGQKVMASSIPVTISSDQSALAVTGTFWQATQPVSIAALPLPSGAAQDRLTAATPFATRLSDGSAFYNAPTAAQLPAALVGGRLDGNIGAWMGATTPTVGQKAMTASIPVALASDQSALAVTGTFWQATQPVSAVSLPLPTGAAQDRTTAASPFAARLSDGSAFYNTLSSTQLPSSLVGGRLDGNIGAWLGATTPTVGQKTMTASIPVTLASDQTTINVSTAAASVLFRGRASSFRMAGRAGTTGHNLMTLFNTTGSAVTVSLTRASVGHYATVGRALTVAPPLIRLWLITVAPTNGDVLSKIKIDGTTTSDANVVVRNDASADAAGSTTTLTVSKSAGNFIETIVAPRLITGAGYEQHNSYEFDLNTPVSLAVGNGILIFLDYNTATMNATTDMWVANIEWTET